MSARTLSAPERIAMANPQLSLGLMLLALHASIAWGIDEWWARAFLLAHLGLFLLWQPVWRGERDIEPAQAFSVVAVACLLVGWYNWWVLAAWLALLVGVIGGSVPRIGERRQRIISVLAALYLLSMLLMWVVPQLFSNQVIEPAIEPLVRYALPLFPIAIMLVRAPPRLPENPVGVDLFYSVLLFLLVVALVLGSFVVRELSHGNYVIALAQTLVGISLVLFGLSWLWYPHSGFAGMGYLLSSYLMSLGLPFERWVQRLAELAQDESDPQRFLALGLQHMLTMPWVRGVEWRTPGGEGDFGSRTSHATPLQSGELKLVIHTRWAVSPAILLHLKLLAQMVGHFYEAKQRAQIQRQNAYTHAIYETGARLTHDVKNLLQSLKALCAAAASTTPEQAQALQSLMQRQLPLITQKLNTTLDKLRAPSAAELNRVDARAWWENLVMRYSGRNISAVIEGDLEGLTVPGEVFDSVADNLVENALTKAAQDDAVHVQVTLSAAGGGTLRVSDSGAPIPRTIAQQLFSGPVSSQTGFGVGLYQAGRLASEAGYRIFLKSNEAGRVCFALAPAAADEGAGRQHAA
ncbi:MAG TPA: ATP-binding protein [Burkholderiales bacterium]|nr:ATP-binding protein [Burkholderiales bacterium]